MGEPVQSAALLNKSVVEFLVDEEGVWAMRMQVDESSRWMFRMT